MQLVKSFFENVKIIYKLSFATTYKQLLSVSKQFCVILCFI